MAWDKFESTSISKTWYYNIVLFIVFNFQQIYLNNQNLIYYKVSSIVIREKTNISYQNICKYNDVTTWPGYLT